MSNFRKSDYKVYIVKNTFNATFKRDGSKVPFKEGSFFYGVPSGILVRNEKFVSVHRSKLELYQKELF